HGRAVDVNVAIGGEPGIERETIQTTTPAGIHPEATYEDIRCRAFRPGPDVAPSPRQPDRAVGGGRDLHGLRDAILDKHFVSEAIRHPDATGGEPEGVDLVDGGHLVAEELEPACEVLLEPGLPW